MAKWSQAYKCESCEHEQIFCNDWICEECGEIGISRGKAKTHLDPYLQRVVIQGSWKPRKDFIEGKKKGDS